MNYNLKKAGSSLLNALSNHSELVMEAYFSGSINEADYTPKVINNLLDLKVIWRPENERQLRLRPALRTLLEESLQDENNRQIDANIGSSLVSIKTQAEHYKEALNAGRFKEAESMLSDVTERVYSLTDMLATNVRLLWSRISNEFGYVATVDAKIRENELAQSQVSELLNQLSMFQFDQLSDISGSHRELRHLLVVTLQSSFAHCTQELSLAQAKLIDLLGRFREFKGRTRLLKGFVLHLEQNPSFAPQNYSTLSNVPALFNVAESTIAAAAIDVNNVEQEQSLLEVMSNIKHVNRQRDTRTNLNNASPLTMQDENAIELQESLLKSEVDAFFCAVIDSGTNQTALDYYKTKNLDFDPEVWLYQVIGGFHGLPEQDKSYFALETRGVPDPVFSGNFVITDIEIGLQ